MLYFGIRDGEAWAIARTADLPALREIEEEAYRAFSAIEDDIIAFESQTVGDAAAKLRHYARENYLVPVEGCCLAEEKLATFSGRFIVAILRDLERLAGRGGAT